ncbi:MAG: MBOAT family O-acyltransferase [Ferruginibacter sp.]
MIFNSINYFIFFSAVFAGTYLTPAKLRWALLLAASISFYLIGGGLSTITVPFIIILVTFYCGIYIKQAATASAKKAIYLTGLIVNIGLLMFFKYINFFIETAYDAVYLFREKTAAPVSPPFVINVIIPLGISYITFQAIGYLIEVKRGSYEPEKHLGVFASYLLFFPKLLSGPIEPAQNFLPQLHQNKGFDIPKINAGLRRMLWGLFLKLAVANRLEIYTDAVFGNYTHHTGSTLLVGAFFYTIQMFADFAGYTNMAIGSAQILGYDLMDNFNVPFVAKSVTEFWRRWHISLSSWVNEYIYNPVSMGLRSWNKWAVVAACMVTFLILGFWHGASWNYIAFGFMQGVILSVEMFTRKTRKKIRGSIPSWLNTITGTLFTFSYFCFSLVIFRNTDMSDAVGIVKKIFTHTGTIYYDNPSMILFCCLGAVIVLVSEFRKEYFKNFLSWFDSGNWLVRNIAYVAVIMLILIMGVFDGGQFIYFKF